MVSSGSGLGPRVPAAAGWQREAVAVGEASPAPGQALGELGWSQLAPWSGRGPVASRPHRQGFGKQTWLGGRPGAEDGAGGGWGRAGGFHKEWSWWASHPSGLEGLKLAGGGCGAEGREAGVAWRLSSMEGPHWPGLPLPPQAAGTSSPHIWPHSLLSPSRRQLEGLGPHPQEGARSGPLHFALLP